MIDPKEGQALTISDDEWKYVVQNVQNSKKTVDVTIEEVEDSRFIADETSDEIMYEMQKGMINSNDIKIVSRINAIQSLSDLRIREKENDLIGADDKEAEKIKRSIAKEKEKTQAKLDILEKKRQLGCSSSLLGLCVLDVV